MVLNKKKEKIDPNSTPVLAALERGEFVDGVVTTEDLATGGRMRKGPSPSAMMMTINKNENDVTKVAASPTSSSISSQEYRNIVLLVLLYLLQGVPLGLSFGSIPFLLKSKLSFSDLALFSLSSYPYSLKLLWSPIVDSIHLPSIGRRKSWIIPIQLLLGCILIYLSTFIDSFLEQEHIPVLLLALSFTFIVFLCATQDIAVDGWALSLLQGDNKTYASTAQTIGLNTGYFLSFTIFLAFSSPEFCNHYIRQHPESVGVLSLGNYLWFWGVAFLACDAYLIFLNREVVNENEVIDSVSSVYHTIYNVCRMPHMFELLGLLLFSKIGFITNESVTGLRLLELGFSKEDLALAVLIDFPFQLIFGYYAAKWSSGDRPLRPWLYGFYGRMFAAIAGLLLVWCFPKNGVNTTYFGLVMAVTIFNSFASTVQFVGLGSYFTQISDPLIGGTYMTLLNTFSNLGGTWPKYFVLQAVDYFTSSACSAVDSTKPSTLPLRCNSDALKAECKTLGGTCSTQQDGYFIVGSVGIVLGMLSLLIILPRIRRLESLPRDAWRYTRLPTHDLKSK